MKQTITNLLFVLLSYLINIATTACKNNLVQCSLVAADVQRKQPAAVESSRDHRKEKEVLDCCGIAGGLKGDVIEDEKRDMMGERGRRREMERKKMAGRLFPAKILNLFKT
jgi:hypothetical protein